MPEITKVPVVKAISTPQSLWPGGGLLSPKLYVDVPTGPQKSDFLYTNLFAKFPTHQYNIFKRKAPNFD